MPTRGLLAVETMHAIVRWLANLNIKRNMTSMFVNKKHRYSYVEIPVSYFFANSAFACFLNDLSDRAVLVLLLRLFHAFAAL